MAFFTLILGILIGHYVINDVKQFIIFRRTARGEK